VIAEAIEAFRNVHGQLNGLGKVNDGALVQEFLSGTEYVLDGVCRDGLYKITAIWEYDKRSVNGANFVYFGMKLIPGDSARAKELIDYGKKIVKALGVVNGPSHMELMYCADGPCLVEVGSRCHGGEGSWLPVAQECVGYTQVEACLSSYLRPDRFDMLPLVPTLLKQGREVFLVSRQTGILQDIPGLQTMRNLKSFR
jgi:biotin carboxylase